MALNRDDLHKLLDKIPQESIPKVAELLCQLIKEDDEPLTEKEYLEIREAEKRISNGEYIVLEDLIQKYGEK